MKAIIKMVLQLIVAVFVKTPQQKRDSQLQDTFKQIDKEDEDGR